jgi:hypothetical protein
MPPAGFEHTNPTIELQQIHTLNPSATGIGQYYNTYVKMLAKCPLNIKKEHLDILPFS